MKKDFFVSVIIPVYKAENFIREAVESAEYLSEVGEIILVEDGSPDNSLKICQELKGIYRKVKLFQHPYGMNKGAGASRNLGILNSKFSFISFLDADDLYLPNRFEQDKLIFCSENADIVYNNGGGYKENWLYYNDREIKLIRATDKNEFLINMLRGLVLHTNCITIRKTLFNKAGLFNEDLVLHQDTDLWFRLVHFGIPKPGNLQAPVSLTRNHPGRRINSRNKKSERRLLLSVLENFKEYEDVDPRFITSILNRYIINAKNNKLGRVFFLLNLLIKSSFYRKKYIFFR